MRLTNVAHLQLPFGRLHGYSIRTGGLGHRLPLSFDQRRHVANSSTGTWMAMSFRLPEQVSHTALGDAWLAVVRRHGTLRTVVTAGEQGDPELHEVEVLSGEWHEHEIGQGQGVNEALRQVFDEHCAPRHAPSHRLCLLETAAESTVIIAADHSHVDMWSMLVIARDLLAALDGSLPAADPPAFAAHTRALLAREPAPGEVRQRWAEILAAGEQVMPRFPLPLGHAAPQPERVEVRDVLDNRAKERFAETASDAGVSTLSLAVSEMTAVTRELSGKPLRAVFPVHSRYEECWHNSVGWFITNSVIESAGNTPEAAASSVREAVRLGSWPLEDVLEPWGGMPEAPGMFAISWLDLRRLPVQVDGIGLDARYIGATIRTSGVMLWFILDDAGLHLRCRYPDTHEARANVGGWLDLLVKRLQERAQ